jgi:hypothetical protein
MRGAAKSKLFNYLIGTHQERLGNLQADRLGGLEIDDQIEFGWLQYRQVGGLLALEDAANINAGLTVAIGKQSPVAHQHAATGGRAFSGYDRQFVMQSERANLVKPTCEK